MRLRGDGTATLFVAAAVALSVLWWGGIALQDMSTRAFAAIVLGLGWVGCTSNQAEMASVYGVGDRRRAPMTYVVIASSLGALALISGLVAVAWRNETMAAVLVAAMVVLWLLATVRHLTARDTPARAHVDREPIGKAA